MKGIVYKTVWVEYLDIAPLCKKIGVGPTTMYPDGSPQYTLPAIYDPNTSTAVVDSAAIVRYLEKTYPSAGPILLPPTLVPFQEAFWAAFAGTLFGGGHLVALTLPPVCAAMPPRSADAFRHAREALHGPVDVLAPPGSQKRATHWEGLQVALGTIASWLGKTADGKERLLFLGGEDICYADVTVAGFMKCIQKLTPPEEWEAVKTWDGGRWDRFMEAFQPYELEDVGVPVDL